MPARSSSSRVGGAGLLALVATYGIGRQAYGLFVPTFRTEFGLGLDTLGFYASAAQAGFLLATVATGVAAARFGARLPVVAGCLLLAMGAGMVAVAPGPLLMAVGVVVAGTSAGGTWGPFSDAVARQVEPDGRRRALALVNAGAPTGLVAASLLVLAADERWRIAWLGFAVVGLVAAAVNARVLVGGTGMDGTALRSWPGMRWFFATGSARLFALTALASITSGAYFAYAPDTAQAAGLPPWSGPAMWLALGIAGSGVGIFAAEIAERWGLRRSLAAALVVLAGSLAALLPAGGSLAGALVSAAAFGASFTTAFGFIVMWSQDVFDDRPTTGFTATIVSLAAGFVTGPAAFGLLATGAGRSAALLALAVPAVAALALLPRRERSA